MEVNKESESKSDGIVVQAVDKARKRRGNEQMIETFIKTAKKQKWHTLNLNKRSLFQHIHLFGSIFMLHHLDGLLIRNNSLVHLSSDIKHLSNLKRLNIGDNKIKALPKGIGALKHLTELICSQNVIEELPSEIGNLQNLKVLDLSENKLIRVSEKIGDCTSLISLNLSNNSLYKFDSEISRLEKLEVLNLSDNPFGVISAELLSKKTQLKEIWLNNCSKLVSVGIDGIDFSSLKSLFLTDCSSLQFPPHKFMVEFNIENEREAPESLKEDMHPYLKNYDKAKLSQKTEEIEHENFCDAAKTYLVTQWNPSDRENVEAEAREKANSDEADEINDRISRKENSNVPDSSTLDYHKRSSKRYKIGPWILREVLGKGEYARVKLAIHEHTGKKAAVKIVVKSKVKKERKVLERLEREIVVGKLLRHPNMVRLQEVYETSGTYYMVMEHAEGDLLEYMLSKGSVLEEKVAKRIFKQILIGVEFCHACNVIHRDLKLENILVDEHGNCKLADFGMCNIQHNNRMFDSSCGSPLYAAPEILSATPHEGPPVDIWALGVILYCLICGYFPFDESNEYLLFKKIRSGQYPPPFGSVGVRDLIKKILQVDPSARPTIQQIKDHPWVKDEIGGWPNLLRGSLSSDISVEDTTITAVSLSATVSALSKEGSDPFRLLSKSNFSHSVAEEIRSRFPVPSIINKNSASNLSSQSGTSTDVLRETLLIPPSSKRKLPSSKSDYIRPVNVSRSVQGTPTSFIVEDYSPGLHSSEYNSANTSPSRNSCVNSPEISAVSNISPAILENQEAVEKVDFSLEQQSPLDKTVLKGAETSTIVLSESSGLPTSSVSTQETNQEDGSSMTNYGVMKKNPGGFKLLTSRLFKLLKRKDSRSSDDFSQSGDRFSNRSGMPMSVSTFVQKNEQISPDLNSTSAINIPENTESFDEASNPKAMSASFGAKNSASSKGFNPGRIWSPLISSKLKKQSQVTDSQAHSPSSNDPTDEDYVNHRCNSTPNRKISSTAMLMFEQKYQRPFIQHSDQTRLRRNKRDVSVSDASGTYTDNSEYFDQDDSESKVSPKADQVVFRKPQQINKGRYSDRRHTETTFSIQNATIKKQGIQNSLALSERRDSTPPMSAISNKQVPHQKRTSSVQKGDVKGKKLTLWGLLNSKEKNQKWQEKKLMQASKESREEGGSSSETRSKKP